MPDGVVHEPLRVLLITHNASGVYDDMESRLSLWIDRLTAMVAAQRAEFIAIHMQEVGGSNYKNGGLALVDRRGRARVRRLAPSAFACAQKRSRRRRARHPRLLSSGERDGHRRVGHRTLAGRELAS